MATSRGIDYSKWDTFDDEDKSEGDESSASAPCSEAPNEHKLREMEVLKGRADALFERAEHSQDEADYHAARHIYLELLPRLSPPACAVSRESSSASAAGVKLRSLCHLNLAGCLVRLQLWSEAIEQCDALLNSDLVGSITPTQRLRAYYFRCASLLKLNGEKNVYRAQEDAEAMRELLRHSADYATSDQQHDYSLLLEAVQSAAQSAVQSASQSKGRPNSRPNGRPNSRPSDSFSSPPTAPSISGVSGMLDAAQRLLRGQEFEAAFESFANVIDAIISMESTSSISTMPPQERDEMGRYSSLLSQAFYGKGKALIGMGRQCEAAESFEAAALHNMGNALSSAGHSLRAAAIYLKLRNMAAAQRNYSQALTLLTVDGSAKGSETTTSAASDKGFDVLEEQDAGVIASIARTGLATCLAHSRSHSDAVEHFRQASIWLKGDVLARLPKDVKTLPQKDLLAIFQELHHLWSAFDGLADSLAHMKCWREAITAVDEALLVHHRVFEFMPNSLFKSRDSSEGCGGGGIAELDLALKTHLTTLRRRSAGALLSKGHLLHAATEIESDGVLTQAATTLDVGGNTIHYDTGTHLEAVSQCWENAAATLSELNDAQRAYTAYVCTARMWAKAAGVEAFALEAVVNVDAAEKAHEAWRNAAREVLRGAAKLSEDITDAASAASQSSASSLEQERACFQRAMDALYEAGLCAMHYDAESSERAFEAARAAMDSYDSATKAAAAARGGGGSGCRASEPDVDEGTQQLNYHLACGDLAFHQGHCYMRLGKSSYALQEATRALEFFDAARNRKRKKMALGLKAMALSALGKIEEAEEVIQMIKGLCLGPVEGEKSKSIFLFSFYLKNVDVIDTEIIPVSPKLTISSLLITHHHAFFCECTNPARQDPEKEVARLRAVISRKVPSLAAKEPASDIGGLKTAPSMPMSAGASSSQKRAKPLLRTLSGLQGRFKSALSILLDWLTGLFTAGRPHMVDANLIQAYTILLGVLIALIACLWPR